ncbi:hypothetical protein [Tepidibacter aestuarii]|uniref:hypothetical protein n=1 Tax=Tepidibacter aestuarii TaxID=2925782 RepID=UPI0020C163E0|nr:hypothetical protein [Tepidibacter aestuarii]CAH2214980.1 membrane protein of unknown function [Tepidibacter aestuarii]
MKSILNFNISILLTILNWIIVIIAFLSIGNKSRYNTKEFFNLNQILAYYVYLSFIPAVVSAIIAARNFINKTITLKNLVISLSINITFLVIYIAFIWFSFYLSRHG